MKVLECSSKGDKRFSALYAKVSVDGVLDTIENHYQKSKVFEGKKVVGFSFRGKVYSDLNMLTYFYYSLWYKYLIVNSTLVEYLREFDDYHDMFRKKITINCQADCIREYVKFGSKEYFNKYVLPFNKIINNQ